MRLVAITRPQSVTVRTADTPVPAGTPELGNGRNAGRRRRSGSLAAPPRQQNQPVEVTLLVTTAGADGLTGVGEVDTC